MLLLFVVPAAATAPAGVFVVVVVVVPLYEVILLRSHGNYSNSADISLYRSFYR